MITLFQQSGRSLCLGKISHTNTRQGKGRQGRAGQGRAGQGRARQGKASQLGEFAYKGEEGIVETTNKVIMRTLGHVHVIDVKKPT